VKTSWRHAEAARGWPACDIIEPLIDAASAAECDVDASIDAMRDMSRPAAVPNSDGIDIDCETAGAPSQPIGLIAMLV
jgi:hypothetical protein